MFSLSVLEESFKFKQDLFRIVIQIKKKKGVKCRENGRVAD